MTGEHYALVLLSFVVNVCIITEWACTKRIRKVLGLPAVLMFSVVVWSTVLEKMGYDYTAKIYIPLANLIGKDNISSGALVALAVVCISGVLGFCELHPKGRKRKKNPT